MKMTLLEIVQDILNDMSSDEVNSIDDTTESQQVAQIVKSTYFALIHGRDWPHTKRLIQVDPSGDDDLPTHMYIQGAIKKITMISYDKAKASDLGRRMFSEIRYIEPDDFLRMCNTRNTLGTNQRTVVDPKSSIEFTIRTNASPEYYTSFDDSTLVFDSYDSSVDTTLQKNKIQVYAYVIPEWVHEDKAYPDLPDAAFTYLLEEAKSRAAFKVRQQPDQKAEQEAQKQKKWLARNDRKVARGIRYPDYGRRGRRYYRDPTFRSDD